MRDDIYTIVDVETTGGSPFLNRIIEVGLVRVEHGEVVNRFSTLVNPGVPIPEFITKLTGIESKDVLAAPTFEEIKDELSGYFEGSVFVAHNAVFDYAFLQKEFGRLGYGFTLDTLCTVKLSRAFYPEEKHHNLSAIIERFSFVCERRHRALDDALVLWDFMQLLQARFPAPEVTSVMERLIGSRRKLPLKSTDFEYVIEE